MKKRILYIVVVAAILSLSSCVSSGRYVVRERPAAVVYSRPPAPSAAHIWITGDWVWSGGRYRWNEGHWERPRPHARWQEGHWVGTGRGWKWVRGRWR